MTHDGRIDPQPVTLDVVPVTMIENDTRREALAAANGRDLVQERVTQVVRFLGVVVLLLAAVRLLVGCTALEAARTAREVATVGCALLGAGDGSTADVLATTAKMQQALLEASAAAAKAHGADAATIDRLVASVAVLARTLEAASKPIVEAGGNAPARLPPCPATTATAAPSATP